MSSLSNINSSPAGTPANPINPTPSSNANAAAVGGEQLFDARNVNANRFRIGGFEGGLPAGNFLSGTGSFENPTASAAEGDVDGPTPTTKQPGQQGQEEEDEGELSDDEKVRRDRQRQWAAMVASGEIEPSKLNVRPGQRYTLPVEKPKFY
ncbi:hypothetical protein EC957_005093 [Mortierella hygrophila]|uniref:Uncharacterized protein n=1 Tax=Mortierella hygrophila TaxID=979708 RepID=A0A9P6F0S2_9FUNG|nr:hypothetical protein EC957_005093 [Mortierella hygrophila]